MVTEPSRDLVHQLSRAERLLAGRMSEILATEDCTLEQWRMLKLLADGRGHVMTDVAGFAMLPASALTTLVDCMVSEGILYRRADDTDRRRVLVYLSLHGRDLYERAAEVLSAAEAELAAARGGNGDLSRLLARLADTLACAGDRRADGPA